ncbi:DUF4491 domain-containing protein, partial [Dysosmobacter welbionis]
RRCPLPGALRRTPTGCRRTLNWRCCCPAWGRSMSTWRRGLLSRWTRAPGLTWEPLPRGMPATGWLRFTRSTASPTASWTWVGTPG